MNIFTPSNPAFEDRVRESFTKQTIMATLGASLVSIRAGEVLIELPYAPHILQQQGFLHAGVTTTIVDSACGYAALTLMPDDADVVSVEFKINMLAPAVGERFIARGQVVKAGKTLTICTGEVLAVKNGEERAVALMQATMMTVER